MLYQAQAHRNTAMMHDLFTPPCCKTPLPHCFAATERVWLYFRRCNLTLSRFLVAMRSFWLVMPRRRPWNESLQLWHGAWQLSSCRYIIAMEHCNATMEHCSTAMVHCSTTMVHCNAAMVHGYLYLTIAQQDIWLYQAAMNHNGPATYHIPPGYTWITRSNAPFHGSNAPVATKQCAVAWK